MAFVENCSGVSVTLLGAGGMGVIVVLIAIRLKPPRLSYILRMRGVATQH